MSAAGPDPAAARAWRRRSTDVVDADGVLGDVPVVPQAPSKITEIALTARRPCLAAAQMALAIFVSQILRGSRRRAAPLRTAFFIRSASTGCASVVFEPITSRKRAFSISGIELVLAPLPNDLTRP
jgi:hypothetical protein